MFKTKVNYISVIGFIIYHILSLHGIIICFYHAKLNTILFSLLIYYVSSLSITIGVHRLWCHRTYKAHWTIKLMLMIFNSIAFQHSIFHWSRDHRLHHKFVDTDADPYNYKRGFFFAHIGWLMCDKHPDVFTEGRKIIMHDLSFDQVVMFQHKYYKYMVAIFCYILPTIIPWLFWKESLYNSLVICAIMRHLMSLHVTFTVNSVAHKFGDKPYNTRVTAVDNWWCSLFTYGECFHNYHHAYPNDYAIAEHDNVLFNHGKLVIDLFYKLGLAHDLKRVQKSVVKKRASQEMKQK